MNRFANKVLQLGEANVELQVHSNPTTPMSPSQCDLTNDKLSSNDKVTANSARDTEKVQNHDETDSVVQSEQPTNTDKLKNRETSEVIDKGNSDTSNRCLDSAMIELILIGSLHVISLSVVSCLSRICVSSLQNNHQLT